MHGAQAQDTGPISRGSADVVHFEIPAEPLDEALDVYGHTARLGVLIDGNLLDGSISAAVSGDYSPRDALQRLLAGTGLQAHFTGTDAAVVVRSPALSAASSQATDSPTSSTIPAADIDGVDGHAAYAALVQSRLTTALCRTPQTRPGSYRLVVQLLIDDAGSVTDAKVIGVGDAARQAAVARVARSVVLGEAPPAGLRQPVTVLLRPLGNGVVPDCAQADGRG